MARIKKVLNSSVVLITDEKDAEYIILGKGIGYGRKQNEELSVDNSTFQTFIPVANNKSKQIVELLNSIAPEILDVTYKMITLAKEKLHSEFNNNLYFILADHLNFAVQRFDNNMFTTNRLLWEVKNFYPDEFSVGMQCLDLFNKALHMNLPESEAVSIAFHLINAQAKDNPDYDSARYAKLIGEIVNLVCYSLNKPIAEDSIHYLRFVTHIRFFVERFFTNKMLEENDNAFRLSIHDQCKKEVVIADKVKNYLLKQYDKEITREEQIYLIIHINRLNIT